MSRDFLSCLSESLRAKVKTGEPMSQHTSFKIGGPADFFLEPESIEDIREALLACRKVHLRHLVIGNGSNLVVADQGVRGLVLCLGPKFAKMQCLSYRDMLNLSEIENEWLLDSSVYPHTPVYADFGTQPVFLRTQAGAEFRDVSALAKSHGLAGLEFACGIPGSVGGAIYMNAGAYGNSVEDSALITLSMTSDGQLAWTAGQEHQFGYRTSYFSKSSRIVLETFFCLRPGHEYEINACVADYTNRRNTTQPLEMPSAGSMFKRPHGYFAGKLIADAGLKGFRVGEAAVSEKHAGFVVNHGGATASDVRRLVREIQRVVFEQAGVILETEVRFVGDWEHE